MNLIIQADVATTESSIGEMFRREDTLYNLSKKDFSNYARYHGADYHLIDQLHPEIGNSHPTYLRCLPIIDSKYDKYDYVLYADCDVLIHKIDDDIFADFADSDNNSIGAVSVLNNMASVEAGRRRSILIQCEQFGIDPDVYFNAGIIVMGLDFRKNVRKIWHDYQNMWITKPNSCFTDQTVLNKIATDMNCIQNIDPKWNFLQKWENGDFSKANFVHLLDKNISRYLAKKNSL